ncbi:ankyrin repeat domain-containing protein 27-like isoform X2 [Watersipora subatra]|uniref:ankyrin repeat domain-containing protein 27-like isoform X2 n=1 Tax=Watersipora subatra TaxID=2589382 RepID=UPI00355AE8A6
MEMSQLYDEDLFENKFFQQFCDMCPTLFNTVVQNGWLICIPKVGTFEGHTLTELDCMSHVLIAVDSLSYKTASDKRVRISEKIIHLEDGFDRVEKVMMLFSETFYTDKQQKYQVCCIEKPLSFKCTAVSPFPTQPAQFRISNVEDSMELLFTGSNCSLKKTLDKMISTHRSALRVGYSSLRHLIDMIHGLFTKCVQTCYKDSHLRRRMALNKHISDNLHLAVETYISHQLYSELFGYICTAVASNDAKLNKINRNLSQVHRTDFGIVSEFSCNLPRARRELLTFASFSTPLAKMASVKRVILALMKQPKDSQELEPLTADDLIPMLVFLIVRSSIPTWVASFEYMSQFHFSKSRLNEYSFYMSTLEAAIFYLQSGELSKLLTADKSTSGATAYGAKTSELSTRKVAVPPIDRLFESIKHSDMEAVRSLLGHPGSVKETSTRRLCHPLCSCDKCEQERDEEGTNPRTMVTVFSRDDKGYTAMHQAALYGRAEVIEFLVVEGSVMDATDYHSSTPLHIASQRGHQSAVMMLIDHGANVNASDNDGNRPLNLAALNGHEDCVKALLYQLPPELIDINATNDNGDTALHHAAKWSYESIIRLLLEQGAWPEARNKRNATPMMLVSNGNIAQLLTKAIEKAQENANDGFIEVVVPRTPPRPLGISSELSKREGFGALASLEPQVKVNSSVQKFLKSVSRGDINMARHLMGWDEADDYKSSDSSDDESPDANLCHPLCQCRKCAPGLKSAAGLVDVNSVDEQGRTALHLSAENSDFEMTSLLLEKDAEVNGKTSVVQFTPLHLACQQLNPNKELVALLLENDAKVNCRDCNGRTPLHFSSQSGSLPVTKLLLEYNGNVNATNVRGNTPLHEAAKVNNIDIVQLLLEHNSNPTLANKNGVTAMQITSDFKVIQMITEYTARWKDMQGSGMVSRKPSVCSLEGRTSEPPSVVMKKKMFAALEEDDIQKLNELTSSINRFNRKSLKKIITRDRSAPLLDIKAIAAARHTMYANMNSGLFCKDDWEKCEKETRSPVANPLADQTEIMQTADDYHFSADTVDAVYDDEPECDFHIAKETMASVGHGLMPAAVTDNHCENSGTESAGEHE